jgi:hypothetical protein
MPRHPNYILWKEAVLPLPLNKNEKKVAVYLRHQVVLRVPDDPVDLLCRTKVLAVSTKIMPADDEEYCGGWRWRVASSATLTMSFSFWDEDANGGDGDARRTMAWPWTRVCSIASI